MARKLIKKYQTVLDPSHTVGDAISLQIRADGMHVSIAGMPFTEEFTSGDPVGEKKQIVISNREVALIVRPGGALEVELAADGTVSIHTR